MDVGNNTALSAISFKREPAGTSSLEEIARDMACEAASQTFTQEITASVHCNSKLIDDYLSGKRDAAEEEADRMRQMDGSTEDQSEVEDWNVGQQSTLKV